MKREKRGKGILILAVLLLFAVSLFSVFSVIERMIEKKSAESAPLYSDSGDSRVLFRDRWYTPKNEMETLLLMGIDSLTLPDGTKSDSAQADFIALIVIDRRNESFRILHLNRDTMTDITQIDENGTPYGVFHAQLALAHTYGAPGKMQCRNTVDTVENLLYGIKIDHYLSITMDTVSILNDSIGGVSVTLAEDFPILGESFVRGAEITLKGEEALTFVRWRNNDAETSNLARMERQRQYINALFSQYTALDPENTFETMLKVNEYLVSDCTVNQLSLMIERLQDYAYGGTVALEGEAVKGAEYVEYYVDEAAAQSLVLNLFYELEE